MPAGLTSTGLNSLVKILSGAIQGSNVGNQANLWLLGLLWTSLLVILYGGAGLGNGFRFLVANFAQVTHNIPVLSSITSYVSGLAGGSTATPFVTGLTPYPSWSGPPTVTASYGPYLPSELVHHAGAVTSVAAPDWVLLVGALLWVIGVVWAIVRLHAGADDTFGGADWSALGSGMNAMIGVVASAVVFFLAPTIVTLVGTAVYDPVLTHLYASVASGYGDVLTSAGQVVATPGPSVALMRNPLYVLTSSIGMANSNGIDSTKLLGLAVTGGIAALGTLATTVIHGGGGGGALQAGMAVFSNLFSTLFNVATLISVIHLLLMIFVAAQGLVALLGVRYAQIWALGAVARPTRPEGTLRWLGWLARSVGSLGIISLYGVATAYMGADPNSPLLMGAGAPVLWVLNDVLALAAGLAVWRVYTKPVIYAATYRVPMVLSGIGGWLDEAGEVVRAAGHSGGRVLSGIGRAGSLLTPANGTRWAQGLHDAFSRSRQFGEAVSAGGDAVADRLGTAGDTLEAASRRTHMPRPDGWTPPYAPSGGLTPLSNPLDGIGGYQPGEAPATDPGLTAYTTSIGGGRPFAHEDPDGTKWTVLPYQAPIGQEVARFLEGQGVVDPDQVRVAANNQEVHLPPELAKPAKEALDNAMVARSGANGVYYTSVSGVRVAVSEQMAASTSRPVLFLGGHRSASASSSASAAPSTATATRTVAREPGANEAIRFGEPQRQRTMTSRGEVEANDRDLEGGDES